jgi:hypothetical protein
MDSDNSTTVKGAWRERLPCHPYTDPPAPIGDRRECSTSSYPPCHPSREDHPLLLTTVSHSILSLASSTTAVQPIMTYRLLLGGYRSTIALITFEASPSKIKLVSESPAPKNASWIQPAVSHASKGDKGAQILYSLSEEEKGFAFGIELKDDKVEVTQQRETNGGPAHGKFGRTDAWLAIGLTFSPSIERWIGSGRGECEYLLVLVSNSSDPSSTSAEAPSSFRPPRRARSLPNLNRPTCISPFRTRESRSRTRSDRTLPTLIRSSRGRTAYCTCPTSVATASGWSRGMATRG